MTTTNEHKYKIEMSPRYRKELRKTRLATDIQEIQRHADIAFEPYRYTF